MRCTVPPWLALAAVLAALPGCKKAEGSETAPGSAASAAPAGSTLDLSTPPGATRRGMGEALPTNGTVLGAIAGQVNVMAEPSATARRLGYLRLGAVVRREGDEVSRAGCAGGWFRVKPRGFVCAGPEATTDEAHPILWASARVRPDRATVMPYKYGFVRATLPLYLRAPSQEDQLKSEFKLKEHLAKWAKEGDELNKVVLGSYDVPLDERGVAILGKRLGDVPRPSTTWGQGELFGGDGEADAVPWWLEGSRKIPNLSDFKVPEYAAFADRARRHTGLSFIGSFAMGPEGFNRRFGVTTDMRLAPTSKVKPDTGSPWHGVELTDPARSPPLPFAWVRTTEAKAFKISDGKPRDKGDLEKRSIVMLTGKRISGPDDFYWELKNGLFIKASQAGVVREPAEWPEVAKKGGKWIEVSIENQTLILWQGQRPVYATLVSTGRDGMGDPKKTRSTVRGTFTIRSKHVTATMDSNEGSAAGGKRAHTASEAKVAPADDDPDSAPGRGKKGDREAKGDRGEKKGQGKKSAKNASAAGKGDDAAPARDRDPEYGVTRRRGEGDFWLRDVPYVEYFESGYALHVAYWHDVFGIARSHGCINLAPIDGRFIFAWTDPQIPDGWHGVLSGGDVEGTVVIVHE